MLDHMDGVMWAMAKKNAQFKEDLYFTIKIASQKRPKKYSEVTPTTSLLLMLAHIVDSFRKMQSFRKWHQAIDIDPEDKTSYTIRFRNPFLKNMQKEYCAEDWQTSVTETESGLYNNIFSLAKPSEFGQSSYDPSDWSSDDEQFLTAKSVAQTTPGQSDCATPSLAAARLY